VAVIDANDFVGSLEHGFLLRTVWMSLKSGCSAVRGEAQVEKNLRLLSSDTPWTNLEECYQAMRRASSKEAYTVDKTFNGQKMKACFAEFSTSINQLRVYRQQFLCSIAILNYGVDKISDQCFR